MSNKDLWLKPHDINTNFWWYEDAQGLAVVFYNKKVGSIVQKIPWRSLRNALKRKDKK